MTGCVAWCVEVHRYVERRHAVPLARHVSELVELSRGDTPTDRRGGESAPRRPAVAPSPRAGTRAATAARSSAAGIVPPIEPLQAGDLA
jgi:hypothetical protein